VNPIKVFRIESGDFLVNFAGEDAYFPRLRPTYIVDVIIDRLRRDRPDLLCQCAQQPQVMFSMIDLTRPSAFILGGTEYFTVALSMPDREELFSELRSKLEAEYQTMLAAFN